MTLPPVQSGRATGRTQENCFEAFRFLTAEKAEAQNRDLLGESWFETQTPIIRPEHLATFPPCEDGDTWK